MKTAEKNKHPKRCPVCDTREPWIEEIREVEQVVRGESFTVHSSVTRCEHCGFEILSDEQLDELTKKAADAYRAKHGLLTSAEIIGRRKTANMSQRKFAEFIGVGEASVKRWEKAAIQDQSSDSLIREKTSDKDALSQIFTAYIKGASFHGWADPTGWALGYHYPLESFDRVLDVLGVQNTFVTSRAYQFLAPSVSFEPISTWHLSWPSAAVVTIANSVQESAPMKIEEQISKFEISLAAFSSEVRTERNLEIMDQEDALPLAA